MRSPIVRLTLAVILSFAAGCASSATLRGPSGEAVRVPHAIAGSLELVAQGDASYAAADPAGATGLPGEGKVIRPSVIRLTRDLTVYRLWSGPEVKDAQGRTSRIGQWWTFDAPAGTLVSYRRRYQVCENWNTLRWVAQCTLRRGSVVVLGPGQSVNAQTCQKPDENYPANERDLQVYIRAAWARTDLVCPDESRDYLDDPRNITKPFTPKTEPRRDQ